MTVLKYIGPDPAEIGVVPLPEGWPAALHEEPDKGLAKEKLASGMYEAVKPAKEETADPPG